MDALAERFLGFVKQQELIRMWRCVWKDKVVYCVEWLHYNGGVTFEDCS